MSEIIEKRDVKVKICAFCNKEGGSLYKCLICRRDMCNAGIGQKHTAYSLEVYSFKLEKRLCSAHICKECADRKTDLTIGQLLDGMFGESPVPTISKPENHKDDYLLEILENLSFITSKQIAEARQVAKPEQSVVSVLVEKELITQAQILTAKAAQFGAEIVVLREMPISSEVIKLVPSPLAWRYRIFPVEKTADHIVIAMSDPSDLNTIDSLTHFLNAEIEIRVAAEDDLDEALRKYYPGEFGGLEEVTLPSK